MVVDYRNSVWSFDYCQGNDRECARGCSERSPNRRLPNHQTFAVVERRVYETGLFAPAGYGRQRQRHETLKFPSRSIKKCRLQ